MEKSYASTFSKAARLENGCLDNTVGGIPLNLSEKDQKWLGIKDTLKF